MASFSTLMLLALGAMLCVLVSGYEKKGECAYCKYSYECQSNYCYRYKCLWRNKASFNKCFVPLCGYCKKSAECTTGRCFRYKCVPKLNPYLPKCFPHKPKPTKTATATPTPTPTRSPTPTPSSSVTPTPSSSVTPTPSKSPRALKPNCKPCRYNYECASYKCTHGKCGSPAVVRHCPKGLCEYCRKNSDCKSYICYYGKCVSAPYSRECRH